MCWKKDSSFFPCGIRSKEREKKSLLKMKKKEKQKIKDLINLSKSWLCRNKVLLQCH